MSAQWYDANVALPGCDKNMPGCIIAMGRLNRPSLVVYGGTIQAGEGCDGEKARHRQRVPELRRVPREDDHRGKATRSRSEQLSRRWRMRRDVHGEYDGLRD